MRNEILAITTASKTLQDGKDDCKRFNTICEVVLAMGNCLNHGNNRLGQATGFKIGDLPKVYYNS